MCGHWGEKFEMFECDNLQYTFFFNVFSYFAILF